MNLPTPLDPGYRQVCESAADEIVVSFGEATWDEQRNCVTDVGIFSGGPLWGHWTFFDHGGGTSSAWDGAGVHRPVADFCFKDSTRKELDIWRRFKLGNLPVIPDSWDITMTFPQKIMHLEKDKTAWGWDRVTKVGKIGPFQLFKCHYPVWQIVDGDGKRTKHYDAYVKWAKNVSTCATSDFCCHKNLNTEGKMLMPRAQSDLCGYAVRGAVRRNTGGVVPTGAFCEFPSGMKITGGSSQVLLSFSRVRPKRFCRDGVPVRPGRRKSAAERGGLRRALQSGCRRRGEGLG